MWSCRKNQSSTWDYCPWRTKGFISISRARGVTERRWVVLLRCHDIEILATEDAEFEATWSRFQKQRKAVVTGVRCLGLNAEDVSGSWVKRSKGATPIFAEDRSSYICVAMVRPTLDHAPSTPIFHVTGATLSTLVSSGSSLQPRIQHSIPCFRFTAHFRSLDSSNLSTSTTRIPSSTLKTLMPQSAKDEALRIWKGILTR